MKPVIVAGGGIGGLTISALLAEKGIPVVLLEKQKYTGGYLTDYPVGGYTFSHSIDWVSGLHDEGRFYNLLKKLSILDSIPFASLPIFKRVISNQVNIPFECDFDAFESRFIDNFPHEAEGIQRMVKIIRGFNSPEWIEHFRPYKEDYYLSFLRKLFHDPVLIAVLSANINDNIPAYLILLFFYRCLSKQAYYFKEHNLFQFLELLSGSIRGLGVDIRTGTEVKNMIVENDTVKGVTLTDGTILDAEAVITDIDLSTVYNNMIEPGHVNSYFMNKLNSRKPCYSLVSIFLGIKAPLSTIPTSGEPVVYLPTHTPEDIFSDNPALYHVKINVRSKWQPFLAPAGCSAVDVRALVRKDIFLPWEDDKNYRSDKEYCLRKEIIASALLKNSLKILGPVEDLIEYKRTATPLTLKRYTGNRSGSGMGWELDAKDYFNGFRITSPLKKLYHVGQWASYPGIEGVVNYCYSLFPRIYKDLK